MYGLFTYIWVVYVVNRPHMTTHYIEKSHEKFTTDFPMEKNIHLKMHFLLKMLDFPATDYNPYISRLDASPKMGEITQRYDRVCESITSMGPA